MAELSGAEINVAWYVTSHLASLPMGASVTVDSVLGKLPVEAGARRDVIGSALSFQSKLGAIKRSGTARTAHGRPLAIYQIAKQIVVVAKSRRPAPRQPEANGHDPAPHAVAQPQLLLPAPPATPGSLASQLLDIAGRVETLQRDLLASLPVSALLDEIARRTK